MQTQTAAEPAAPRTGAVAANERSQAFDDNRRFLRGDAAGAERPGFDDTQWRSLDLPHDFSIQDLPPRPTDNNGLRSVWGTAPPAPIRIGPFETELSAGGRHTG